MDGFDDSVMIALLPITGGISNQELPHLTLVYAGQTEDLPAGTFNEMAKVASLIGSVFGTVTLRSLGYDIFGDEEKVDVLRLVPSQELMAMRRMVEEWNASVHPFNPHVTIGPVGEPLMDFPRFVSFDKICVCYGTNMLEFRLKSFN